jgi:two-component system NtrC family sensor kinase
MTVPLRVLIVDDCPSIRRAVRRALKSLCEVSEATNGAEALTLLGAGARFQAILTDIEMPVMDGRALWEEARHLDPSLEGRFIVLTGGTSDDSLRTWFRGLPDAMRLEKPVSAAELLAAVTRIVTGEQPS